MIIAPFLVNRAAALNPVAPQGNGRLGWLIDPSSP